MPSSGEWIVLAQMIGCVVGIYVAFAAWSIYQENLFTVPYVLDDQRVVKFRYTYVVSLLGGLMSTLFSLLIIVITKPKILMPALRAVSPFRSSSSLSRPQDGSVATHGYELSGTRRTFVAIGFSLAFSHGFGVAAMQALSFPMVLTVKMCKMVPVILVGVVWHRNRYSMQKYMDCLLITAGILCFTFLEEATEVADAKKAHEHRRSSVKGFVLVMINLLLDGFSSSSQDALLRKFPKIFDAFTVMLLSNFAMMCWATSLLVGSEVVTHFVPSLAAVTVEGGIQHSAPAVLGLYNIQEPTRAWDVLAHSPKARFDLLMIILCNATGQIFLFKSFELFGALTTIGLTLVRKVSSVLLSILIHNHRVSPWQWSSLIAVFVGVGHDAWAAAKSKSGPKKHHSGAAPAAVQGGNANGKTKVH